MNFSGKRQPTELVYSFYINIAKLGSFLNTDLAWGHSTSILILFSRARQATRSANQLDTGVRLSMIPTSGMFDDDIFCHLHGETQPHWGLHKNIPFTPVVVCQPTLFMV